MQKKAIIEQIIQSRRSIYPSAYTDQIIDKTTIECILDSANYAPTHRMTEPWRFKIVHGPKRAEMGDMMAQLYKEKASEANFSELKFNRTAQKVRKCSHVIAICMQRDAKESVPEWEEIASVAMSVQNMWLTAAAHGIGAYWSSPSTINSEAVAQFLHLSEGQRCLGFLYMGHHQQADADAKRTAMEQKVEWL
jgi:nitroreductase